MQALLSITRVGNGSSDDIYSRTVFCQNEKKLLTFKHGYR